MNLPDAPNPREGSFAIHFFTVSGEDKSKDDRVKGVALYLGTYECSSNSDIFISFLKNRMPFKVEFNEDQARHFYISVRCGLLYEARTKNGWTIWAKHGSRIIDATGAQKILYRDDFQKALCPTPKGGFLSRSWNLPEHFRCYFAMGKIRGTPCMWRHISVHRATTNYFSNSFVFNTKIEKEGLPRDSPAALGAGGLRFKSGRPDHSPCNNVSWRLQESGLNAKKRGGLGH